MLGSFLLHCFWPAVFRRCFFSIHFTISYA
jgi:hypothetical protein